MSLLVKLQPYLISSLGFHAVFIFHGWELTICFFLLFCILFVCFVWLVRYFRLFCLACLFYKSLEQGIVMILPGGTLCTKSFLCVFCFLFCSVGWLCFVCLLGLVLLVCCNFFSSARTFNNFAQGGLCTGSSFCLVLCAGDKRKNSFSARFNLQKISSPGKRC